MKQTFLYFILFLCILFISAGEAADKKKQTRFMPRGPYMIDTEVLKQHQKLYDYYKPETPEVYQIQIDTDWPFCPRFPENKPCWTWGKADYLKNMLRK